jgi:hypothetical protein
MNHHLSAWLVVVNQIAEQKRLFPERNRRFCYFDFSFSMLSGIQVASPEHHFSASQKQSINFEL